MVSLVTSGDGGAKGHVGNDFDILSEVDVLGASLNGKKPSQLNVMQLKRWLACLGAPTGGNVLRRVRGKLYSINRLKALTPTVMKLLYQAHVLPIIDYCDVVWVPTNVGHLKRLERLHSRFSSYDSARSSAFNLTLTSTLQISYCHTSIQDLKKAITLLLTIHIQVCLIRHRSCRAQCPSFVCTCCAIKLWQTKSITTLKPGHYC